MGPPINGGRGYQGNYTPGVQHGPRPQHNPHRQPGQINMGPRQGPMVPQNSANIQTGPNPNSVPGSVGSQQLASFYQMNHQMGVQAISQNQQQAMSLQQMHQSQQMGMQSMQQSQTPVMINTPHPLSVPIPYQQRPTAHFGQPTHSANPGTHIIYPGFQMMYPNYAAYYRHPAVQMQPHNQHVPQVMPVRNNTPVVSAPNPVVHPVQTVPNIVSNEAVAMGNSESGQIHGVSQQPPQQQPSQPPPPQQQPPPQPLAKREKRPALIQDPTTLHTFTVNELTGKEPIPAAMPVAMDTAIPARSSDPQSGASSQRNTPLPQSSCPVITNDAALEFRDKVTSAALSVEDPTSNVASTPASSNSIDNSNAPAISDKSKEKEGLPKSMVIGVSNVPKESVAEPKSAEISKSNSSNNLKRRSESSSPVLSTATASSNITKSSTFSSVASRVAETPASEGRTTSVSAVVKRETNKSPIVTVAAANSSSIANITSSVMAPVANVRASPTDETNVNVRGNSKSNLQQLNGEVLKGSDSQSGASSQKRTPTMTQSPSTTVKKEVIPTALETTENLTNSETTASQLESVIAKSNEEKLLSTLKSSVAEESVVEPKINEIRKSNSNNNIRNSVSELTSPVLSAATVSSSSTSLNKVAEASTSERTSPENSAVKNESSSTVTSTIIKSTVVSTPVVSVPAEIERISPKDDAVITATINAEVKDVNQQLKADKIPSTSTTALECEISQRKNNQIKTELSEPSTIINATTQPIATSVVNNSQLLSVQPNSSGKFAYDTNFLKSLRDHPLCLKKPDSLPDNIKDIVYEKPINERPNDYRSSTHGGNVLGGGGGGGTDMFLPPYMRDNRPNSQPPRSTSSRNSLNRISQIGPKKIIIETKSLTQEVKLHTVSNAWKPSAPKANEEIDPDEAATQDLLKKVRGILNKLTPQKYDKLLEKMKALKIDTENRLVQTLDLIFDKAVDEPAFCIQYANLCKHLASIKVINRMEDKDNPGQFKEEEVKFQKLLLSRCQKEFETDVYEGIDIDGREKDIADNKDDVRKKELKDELEEDKRKARKKSLGNIKLIGELYQLDMLKGNIMISCMKKLLDDREEESLECLCTLLRTIGAKLEPESKDREIRLNLKPIMEPCFNQLKEIVNSKMTSPRVRFMIKDVLDMRRNEWKGRKIHDDNKPKTIDQIHKDVQKEDEMKAHELQQHTMQKRMDVSGGGQKKSTSSRQEEWNLVGRKSQQGNQIFDVNKLKNLKNTSSETVQLGPQSGSWSMGARGGAQQPKPSPYNDPYSANRSFQGSSEMDKKNLSRSGIQGRDSTGKMRMNQMPQMSNIRNQNPSIDYYRVGQRPPQSSTPPFNNDVVVKHLDSRSSSMEKSSAPNSRNSSIRKESPKKDPEAVSKLKGKKDMKKEEAERLSLEMVKEYLNNRDLHEATQDVIQTFHDENVHLCVSSAFNHALEISSQTERQSVGQLLSSLVAEKVITAEQFHKGLQSIWELAEDIAVDVPKFWEYMGLILAPFYLKISDKQRRSFFCNAFKTCPKEKIAHLMTIILKSANTSASSDVVCKLWKSGGLEWSDFLSPDVNSVEFQKENALQFLSSPINTVSSNIDSDKPNSEFEERINSMYINVSKVTDIKNESIFSYIEKNFSPHETSSPFFVSALVKATVRGSIVVSPGDSQSSIYSLDDKVFKSRCPMLAKFCGGEESCEVKSLFALQELMEELQHPARVLNQLFNVLYEQTVISQEAFLQWEASNEAAQLKGKAVAMMNVKQFLTWLKETSDSSDG